ncbi:MAG TPA: polysaccharide biosynthesis tyrosine autokinase, partial [Candidatus Bathyarchaeia archaeon]|nr:polysaccharide biosynthesis tyrosine autokinase [Candidatus Bathyarchaeia archaeon]
TAKDFLDKQLRDSRDQVERADAAVKSFAEQHPDVAVNQEHKLIGQRITQLSQSVSEAEAHRISMQSRYEFMTKNANQPLAFLSDDNMGQGVQKLRLALIDLGVQRASMESRLGPNHPEMVDLAKQGAEIRLQLLSEVGQEVAAAQARFQSAEMREDELRGKLAQLEQKAIDLQNLGTHYEMLKSEADNVRSLHDSLVKQQMETAVHSELAPSNIRVIERAEVPLGPSRPKVPFNLAIGVLAGIVGAVGATLVCENFDNSLKSSEDVESLLQLPTLATIPNFALARRSAQSRGIVYRSGAAAGASAQEVSAITSRFSDDHGRELVVLNEPWSPVAESFRALRTSVLFSTPGAPPKVILVTSTGASEGKTVTSLNLASTLAEAGSRVLLIDVDMRHPSCHRVLGVENERGLSTFLAGFAELPAIVHSLEAPRLFFIPSGPTPPNPAELVGSARMSEAIASLRESYDFVILDSPPVLPVTDAVVLTRESDGVVLVVKGHDTPRELVRRARDQLLLASAHLLGAVVNNVDLGWGDLYFYNRYYGGYYATRPQAEQHA